MGDSLPPPAPFDLISSFARQRGTEIEIVLSKPKLALPEGEIPVSLRRGRAVVSAVGRRERVATGERLTVRVPRAAVDDGRWGLALEHGEGPRERIAARLLVQGRRPLVLLWGATNPPSVVPAGRRPVASRRRVATAAGRALDRALVILPEEQATSTRSSIRKVARRVLR